LPHATLNYQFKKATISLPKSNTTEECVSHELLHLFLETKDLFVCTLIQGLIQDNKCLKEIISEKLVNHMTNCIHHIKMLPYFENMGYKKENFIADYSKNKCEIKAVKQLRKEFKQFGIYNRKALDLYIGSYFAIKADPNEIDYSKQLKILLKTDEILFKILNTFWNKWNCFDVTNDHDYWLDDFAGDFIDSLREWILKRKIK
jgi:hypothetical protein